MWFSLYATCIQVFQVILHSCLPHERQPQITENHPLWSCKAQQPSLLIQRLWRGQNDNDSGGTVRNRLHWAINSSTSLHVRGFWLLCYSTVLSIGELETVIYLRRSSFHCTSPAFSFMFNHSSLFGGHGVWFLLKKRLQFYFMNKNMKRVHLILNKKKLAATAF